MFIATASATNAYKKAPPTRAPAPRRSAVNPATKSQVRSRVVNEMVLVLIALAPRYERRCRGGIGSRPQTQKMGWRPHWRAPARAATLDPLVERRSDDRRRAVHGKPPPPSGRDGPVVLGPRRP